MQMTTDRTTDRFSEMRRQLAAARRQTLVAATDACEHMLRGRLDQEGADICARVIQSSSVAEALAREAISLAGG